MSAVQVGRFGTKRILLVDYKPGVSYSVRKLNSVVSDPGFNRILMSFFILIVADSFGRFHGIYRLLIIIQFSKPRNLKNCSIRSYPVSMNSILLSNKSKSMQLSKAIM